MTCFRPYIRYEIGTKVHFLSAEIKNQGYKDPFTGELHPPELLDWHQQLARLHISTDRADLIPCGQCLGCRLDYSRQWATRIMCEAAGTENNMFITLTYDENHIPYNEKLDIETGEIISNETLYPRDLQLFLKRLRSWADRKYNHQGIRFYGVGEYGEQTHRPHYHAALFNMPYPVEEMIPMFTNEMYDQIYTDPDIENIWGKGIISIGSLSWESAAYIGRYMLKKQKGKGAKIYDKKGIEKEFSRMSRKPGIGKDFFIKNKEKIYKTDEIIIPGKKPKIVKPPKYFDKLLLADDKELMEIIKEKRKEAAEKGQPGKRANTTKGIYDQLQTNANALNTKLSGLERKLH